MAMERDEIRRPSAPLPGTPVRPSDVPTGELLEQLVGKMTRLARKEVELAKTEMKDNLRSEASMATGIGVAGVCALVTLNLLCVALALFLAAVLPLPGWGAVLIVAGAVLLAGTIAGLVGWNKRVRNPLDRTRRTLSEDVKWAKERIA